ncbi:MAG: Tol-Pal system protein TolB, partial [Alphaproteobacteria bacterium]|nr:Tol-Pal system protein TolB [Alphaproteobacteria bacterium]
MLTRRNAVMIAPGIFATRAATAQQGTRIDITRARTEPVPIAIPAMAGATPDGARIGAQIAQVITNNLRNSGLFRPVNRDAFIQTPEAAAATPRFQDWRIINATFLVTGRVAGSGDQLRVEFRLWDILPGEQALGTAYNASASNWRQ